MDVTPEQCAGILNQLADKLGGKELLTRLEPYMGKAFDALRPKLAEYPGPHTGPVRFTTPKQRRFYWWAVKQGLIARPYERTGKLGAGWRGDVEYTVSDTELTGTLSNLASDWRPQRPYGTFVQGSAQQPMHAGTWTLAEAVLEANKQAAVEEIAKGIAEIAQEVI